MFFAQTKTTFAAQLRTSTCTRWYSVDCVSLLCSLLSKLCSRRIPTSTISALLRWRSSDPFDVAFARFWRDRLSSQRSARYPPEFFESVLPVPCHSHNDYWRQTPLFAALGSGCVSIEADIWRQNADLYVGHTQLGLRKNSTLQNMYLVPLLGILQAMNGLETSREYVEDPYGVYFNDPKQTLTLLIDFKSSAADIWPLLNNQLQSLREGSWLTYWNGENRIERPITIVVSGAADFDLVVANQTYRDIFFDAPLDALEDEYDLQSIRTATFDLSHADEVQRFKYNPTNSHLASANFHKAVGSLRWSGLSGDQFERMRKQISNAKERKLIPRYWGTPRWPRSLRDVIWGILVQEEIGLLNVDDLRAVRKGHWGLWPHDGP